MLTRTSPKYRDRLETSINWEKLIISRRSLLLGSLSLLAALAINRFRPLSETAKYLLIYIGVFDRLEGANIQRLTQTSKLSLKQIEKATNELVNYSLVYRNGTGKNQNFFLYPLTQFFIQSKLIKN